MIYSNIIAALERRTTKAVSVAIVAAGALGAFASSAPAIEFQSLGALVHGASSTGIPGPPVRQAGAHPDITVSFFVPKQNATPNSMPAEQPHRFQIDLPLGLTGNPLAAPTCPESGLKAGPNGNGAVCPVGSQVGVVTVLGADGGPASTVPLAVYNVEPRANTPGQFAFNFSGAVVRLNPTVRPGDHGITIDSGTISQGALIFGAKVTMWGVPADPVHDPERYAPILGGMTTARPSPSQSPRRPFLTLPTRCSGEPDVTTARLDGWDTVGQYASQSFSSDLNGVPFITTGCDKLPFAPTIDFQPTSREADAPTGLNVDIQVPQGDQPNGLATAHVKDVTVKLPNGMSVSPSSAAGLGACSQVQIGLGSSDDPACPRSAKIGTVTVETPLLSEPLTGDVFLAAPDHNPFGSLIALYIVVKGSGVQVKLAGRVDANPVTGQLTATFTNNPQLPFSALKLRFDGGANAPLATPPTCGTYQTAVDITSWSGKSVSMSSPMVIDSGCGPRGFAPHISAGSVLPVAGKDSPFIMSIDRPDRQQNFSKVQVEFPPGMLARIKDVDLCPEAQAASGTCGPGSLVGRVDALAGPGPMPLPARGNLYLTGPFEGAPYGLSIVVPTAGQAGPFDLGNIVERAKISVDRNDAHITVASDPATTILRGFPLRVRRISILNDRPGFHFNPTSCKASQIKVATASTEGTTSNSIVPYRLGGCGDLELDQKITLGFTNKTQTKIGKHPGVRAKMTSKAQGTNLRAVAVKLPLSVALDPGNAKALCKPEERAALKCPAASIVGKATAVSVLKQPLKGPIYFVEGTRKSKTGRIIKTLPKLWIPLSGGGITVDVNADSTVDKQQRLVSTFSDLPDAPISSFDLRIGGGKNGILKVPPSKEGGTCTRDRTVYMQLTGQNGKKLERAVKASVDGCKKASKKKAKKASASKRSAARKKARR